MLRNVFKASVNSQTESFGYTSLVYSLAFIPPLLMLVAIAWQSSAPVAFLTKDPLAVAELTKGECCSVYYGILSNAGILLWCSTAAITLFACAFAWSVRSDKSDVTFFAAAGLFTAWLMLDDFFLVHEDVFPALGIPQALTYGLYASLALADFVTACFSNAIARPLLLFAGLSFLGLSALLDIVLRSERRTHILLKDGAKILEISAWPWCHVETAFFYISRKLQKISVGQLNFDGRSTSSPILHPAPTGGSSI